MSCFYCMYCGAEAQYKVTRQYRMGKEIKDKSTTPDQYKTDIYHVCSDCRSKVIPVIEEIVHPVK